MCGANDQRIEYGGTNQPKYNAIADERKASGKMVKGREQEQKRMNGGKIEPNEPTHNIIYGIKFTFLLMLSVLAAHSISSSWQNEQVVCM